MLKAWVWCLNFIIILKLIIFYEMKNWYIFDMNKTKFIVDVYYPGANKLRILVAGDKQTGKLLSAQIARH